MNPLCLNAKYIPKYPWRPAYWEVLRAWVMSPAGTERSPASRDHLGRYRGPRATRGALLRELQVLLKKRDPGFGGLKRVQNKRREFLWIHPRFEKEYYPDPPVIPPSETS